MEEGLRDGDFCSGANKGEGETGTGASVSVSEEENMAGNCPDLDIENLPGGSWGGNVAEIAVVVDAARFHRHLESNSNAFSLLPFFLEVFVVFDPP